MLEKNVKQTITKTLKGLCILFKEPDGGNGTLVISAGNIMSDSTEEPPKIWGNCRAKLSV